MLVNVCEFERDVLKTKARCSIHLRMAEESLVPCEKHASLNVRFTQEIVRLQSIHFVIQFTFVLLPDSAAVKGKHVG